MKKRSLSSFTLASIHDALESEQKPAWSGNKEMFKIEDEMIEKEKALDYRC